MSPKAKNYLIIALAAATLTASSIAWNQSRQLAALNAKLGEASAVAASIKPRSAPATASFTPPPASSDAPAATADIEFESTSSANGQSGGGPRQRGNNGRPNMAALMANPEFAKAMSIQQRASLDNRYGDLFRRLNLPAADLEKFKDLLVERQSARMDVMAAARENGLNPRDNRDEIRKLTEEAQAEVDANIKAVLGDNVLNQYLTYEATQPQRAVVKQLSDRLSYSSTPLNSTQSDFLVNALASSTNSSGGSQEGGGGGWGLGGGNRVVVTDAVIQQAKSVLTPDQLEVLKQIQVEQQAQRRMRELMRPSRDQAEK